MKYAMTSLLLLANNEVISLFALTVIAWMLIADVAKEASKR